MLRTIDSPNTTVLNEQPSTIEGLRKMDSNGDATFNATNLEEMFEHLEENSQQDVMKQKSEIAKISKYLKPKVR